jgi:hypothetical protein
MRNVTGKSAHRAAFFCRAEVKVGEDTNVFGDARRFLAREPN